VTLAALAGATIQLLVGDGSSARAWYERLFDRPPDFRPFEDDTFTEWRFMPGFWEIHVVGDTKPEPSLLTPRRVVLEKIVSRTCAASRNDSGGSIGLIKTRHPGSRSPPTRHPPVPTWARATLARPKSSPTLAILEARARVHRRPVVAEEHPKARHTPTRGPDASAAGSCRRRGDTSSSTSHISLTRVSRVNAVRRYSCFNE
jgi:hypothetical protein